MSRARADVGLEMLLDQDADGVGVLASCRTGSPARTPDGDAASSRTSASSRRRGEPAASPDTDFSVQLRGVQRVHAAHRQAGPGPGHRLAGVRTLIAGLVITFYLPRRRVWARLGPTAGSRSSGRADRYVDFDREFGRLLDDLVAARLSGGPAVGAGPADRLMASLRDVRDEIFPRPARAARSTPRSRCREIAWVRVMKARVPAFDALEPGDLAIVPSSALAMVAPGTRARRGSSTAFGRARVRPLLLVEVETDDDALDALETAATAGGCADLPDRDADPIQLERSVIGLLVNRRAELDHRAGELEAELAAPRSRARARRPRGRDRRVPRSGGGDRGPAGRRVGRPRADRAARGRGGREPVHRPTRPGPAPGRDPGTARRGGAGGRLVLLGEEPANELERIAADRIAALLALELARDVAVRQARDDARRGDPLPKDGPPWVVLLARQTQDDDPDDVAAREATRAELRLLASPRRLVLRGDEREPRAPDGRRDGAG